MQRRLKLLPLSTGRQYSASRNRDPASAGKAELATINNMKSLALNEIKITINC